MGQIPEHLSENTALLKRNFGRWCKIWGFDALSTPLSCLWDRHVLDVSSHYGSVPMSSMSPSCHTASFSCRNSPNSSTRSSCHLHKQIHFQHPGLPSCMSGACLQTLDTSASSSTRRFFVVTGHFTEEIWEIWVTLQLWKRTVSPVSYFLFSAF